MALIVNVYHDPNLYGEALVKPLKKCNNFFCQPINFYRPLNETAAKIAIFAIMILSYPFFSLVAFVGMLIKMGHKISLLVHASLHPEPVKPEESFISHDMKMLDKIHKLRDQFDNSKDSFQYQEIKEENDFPGGVCFAGYYTLEKSNAKSCEKIEAKIYQCLNPAAATKIYLFPYADNFYDNDENSSYLNIILFTDKAVGLEANQKEVDPGFLRRASLLHGPLLIKLGLS